MMNCFPMPNYSGGGIYDNWVASGANKSSNDQFDFKIDYRFNEKNLLSVKYSQDWNNNTPYNCFKNFTDPCGSGPNQGTAHLFAINDTHTFSPTLILTSTLGFTRGTMNIAAYNKSLNSDPAGHPWFSFLSPIEWFSGRPRDRH